MLHDRLTQIKGTGGRDDVLFGGLNIILFGDLLQLPPVANKMIFEPCGSKPSLFVTRFEHIQLKDNENKRQENDLRFGELCSRLRVGRHTCADVELLWSRTIACGDQPNMAKAVQLSQEMVTDKYRHAVRLCATNAECAEFNDEGVCKKAQTTKQPVCTFHALDHIHGDPQSESVTQDMSKSSNWHGDPKAHKLTPNDENRTGSLSATLTLTPGARIMLRRNVDVRDKLVNGSLGTIVRIRSQALDDHVAKNGMQYSFINLPVPERVEIVFDDENAGRKHNGHSESINGNNVWITHIKPTRLSFNGTDKKTRISRTQLPLILAYALTVHKSQGQTLSAVILEAQGMFRNPAMFYVAVSRVRSLNDLIITDWPAGKDPRPNRKALKFMKTLEIDDSRMTMLNTYGGRTIAEEHDIDDSQ